MEKLISKIIIACCAISFFSCKVYKQNILFGVGEGGIDSLQSMAQTLHSNYKIEADDYLKITVYTSKGEMLIDPEKQYFAAGSTGASSTESGTSLGKQYLVDVQGNVNLPMLGKVKIDSLTLPQADSLLVQKYNVFYDSCFVLTSCENRRVTILGAMGNQVIPITNENTNLIEILALAGGAVGEFKSTNIRLIRGDLQNPEVQIVDLSTIEGMKIANLRIQSHDIIYVEPTKKVVNEAIRDISPILSLTTSLITLIILFTANNK